MHYFIDGYNLLFRAFGGDEELQERRARFLNAFRTKIRALGLPVTLVFDAHYHPEEENRSDQGSLRIIFTNVGVTADECLLDLLKGTSQKKILVTSDKRLSSDARRLGAKTETAEAFLVWLNKRFHNRIRRTKKEKTEKVTAKPVETVVEKPKKPRKPGKKATFGECLDYYLEVFEEKMEQNEP